MIRIPRDICIDLDQALNKEWLVANGIGGYASGTIADVLTRRYHGLLVAALKPPVERTMLLAKIDEEVVLDDFTYYLGANEYEGKIWPAGYVHLEEFRVELGVATSVYRVGGATLTRQVWMEYGHNTTYVRYSYEAPDLGDLRLIMHPMCNYRDYHEITYGNLEWNFQVDKIDGGCKVVAREGAVPFWLTTHPSAEATPTGVWYWHFVYRREVERGFHEKEDLYVPCIVRATVRPGGALTFVASTEPPEAIAPLVEGALEREQARQRALLDLAGMPTQAAEEDAGEAGSSREAIAAQLVLAADSFIVTRDVERGGSVSRVPTVIAGYHWFTDWGRDTMISLRGLCLPTGRAREASQIVRTFSLFVRDGLIPNNFPDVGAAPQYNTADGTLWMFAAVRAITESTGNISIARDLYPLLSDVIAWHVRGTSFGIGADPADGLLKAGEAGVQLTWMDAKVDGWVVTPRTGKPVEINALWYNALRFMEKLRVSLGHTVAPGKEEAPDFGALVQQARDSYRRRFWYEEGGYLYDVVDGPGGNDHSLRPNQIFAISLDKDLLSSEQARRVLAVVRRQLMTPYGLRTLSPDDPQYKGRITGDRRARDTAYHNGTVWMWLLGPYLDAVRAVEGEDAVDADLERLLPAIRSHLADAGLGTLSEIFDGDPPHAPRGCISQAWSVAEVLRHLR